MVVRIKQSRLLRLGVATNCRRAKFRFQRHGEKGCSRPLILALEQCGGLILHLHHGAKRSHSLLELFDVFREKKRKKEEKNKDGRK